MSGGVSKITAERSHRALMELVMQPGNDICADCKSKGPRWASYNLGIFICVRCASIHRKIGTHVTKIKSLSLDSWTKEQVEVMRNIGNVKSNQKYNPDERRNPPPISMEESERDSDLEKYIRAKYEYKRFMDKSAQAAEQQGPSQSKSSVIPPPRSRTAPAQDAAFSRTPARASTMKTATSTTASTATVSVNPPPRTSSQLPGGAASRSSIYSSSTTANANPFPLSQIQPQTQHQAKPVVNNNGPIWNDLASLQAPAVNSSMPLQFTSAPATTASFSSQPGYPTSMASSSFQNAQSIPIPISAPAQSSTNPYANLTVSSSGGFSNVPAFPSSFGGNITGSSPNARSFSLPAFPNGTSASVASSPALLQPMPTGVGMQQSTSYNPFNQLQAQQHQFFSPQAVVSPAAAPSPMTFSSSYSTPSPAIQLTASSAPNPFSQSFTSTTPLSMPPTQMQTQGYFPTQPQAQAPMPSPSSFPSSSPFQPQMQQSPFQQPQQQMNSMFGSPPPFSQQAQQAQQLFQSMMSNTNPFQTHA